jgi:EmrB/QacA subfamily drug resistance transporter
VTQEYAEGQDPRRWKALSVTLVAGFMVLLDVSIVNVALPSLRSGLHAGDSDVQWVLSGYALTFGLLLVPAGRLGDARGRRTVFMVGLGLFTVASAACGLAPNAAFLTVARLLQGAAGGLVTPQNSALIQQLFRGQERNRAFGLLGTTIGISTAVGPLLGGALIALFGTASGWRWVFFVNLPVGLVALPLARRLLPAPPPRAEARSQQLDPVGVALLGAAVLMILLPLVQERQWHGPAKWLLTVAGLATGAAFLGWERRQGRRDRQPLVDLALFRERSYGLGAALSLLYFAGFTAVFFTYTLYLQQGLHYSALLAGLATVPFAAGAAVMSSRGAKAVGSHGRTVIVLGLAAVAAGLALTDLAVRLVPGHAAGLVAAAPLLLAGLGSGLVISPNQTLTLSSVPPRQSGSAAGVLQTGQRLGSAVGIAAVGAVFFAGVASSHGDLAAAFRRSLAVIVAFVVASLLVALLDIALGRRDGATPSATS